MCMGCLGEIFQPIFTWSTSTEYARMPFVEWEPISRRSPSPVLERHWGHCHLCSISMIRKTLCKLPVLFEAYPAVKRTDMIIQQLQNSKVFSITPGCKHPTFPHPRDVLHSKEKSELLEWIIEHL